MKKIPDWLKDGVQSGAYAGAISGGLSGLYLGILTVIEDMSNGKSTDDALGFHLPLAIFVCSVLLAFMGSLFGLIYSLLFSSKQDQNEKLYKKNIAIEWGGVWGTLGITCISIIISKSNVDFFSENAPLRMYVEFTILTLILVAILFVGGYIGGNNFKDKRLGSVQE